MWPCLLLVLALLGTVPASSSGPASASAEETEEVTALEVPEEDGGCPEASDTQGLSVPSAVGVGTRTFIVVPYCWNFHRAQKFCAWRYRGHLASIHSARINNFVLWLARRLTNSGQLWIGAVSQPSSRSPSCHWTDRSPWNFHRWVRGHPLRSRRFCTAFCTNNGLWRSVRCKTRMPFICEI